jgi:hypothetical protein
VVSRAGLARAARDILTRPALLWLLAGVFWARIVILLLLHPVRPDATGWWRAGRVALERPGDLYRITADTIAATHRILPAEGPGLLAPPVQALLAMPYALFPERIGIQLWTATDAVLMVLGLSLLYRALAPAHRAARPLCWLLAGFFPPVFADLITGQRGGAILVCAMAAVALAPARPILAGLAGGAAGALKLYPLAMGLGNPRPRFLLALGLSFTVITALSFIPFGDPLLYVKGVLIPAAAVADPDCGITSVPGLWQRTIGGQAYLLPGGWVRTPLHLPLVASALTVLTDLAVIAGTVWAARASGWQPLYGMTLGFALGALLPGEVYPYQWLALLPLVLVLAVRAADTGRIRLLSILMLVTVLGFVRQPCDLPFPNIWALAGLAVYGIGLWHHGIFRPASSDGR